MNVSPAATRSSTRRLWLRNARDAKDHAEWHGVTSSTALLDLRELEQRGLLRAHGQRRSLRFTAPD